MMFRVSIFVCLIALAVCEKGDDENEANAHQSNWGRKRSESESCLSDCESICLEGYVYAMKQLVGSDVLSCPLQKTLTRDSLKNCFHVCGSRIKEEEGAEPGDNIMKKGEEETKSEDEDGKKKSEDEDDVDESDPEKRAPKDDCTSKCANSFTRNLKRLPTKMPRLLGILTTCIKSC